MATWLKQSTAVDIAIGPFLDNVDGFTAENALTITQADVRLKKNNGNWAQKNQVSSAVNEENGWYEVSLDTTDTNTLGILIVAVNESGALPVWREFLVVAANVYDSIVGGGDVLDVSVTQWLGTAAATPTVGGVPEVDVTHWLGTAAATPTTGGVPEVDLTHWSGTLVSGAVNSRPPVTLSLFNGSADAGSTASELVDAALSESTADYWKGNVVLVKNGANTNLMRLIVAFDPATDKLTVAPAFPATIAAGDLYEIWPAAAVNVRQWLEATANALVSGRVDASVGAVAADAITAASIANGAIDAATFAAGAIDAAAIATNAIDADSIAADAITAAKIANGAIDAATFAAGAIDAAALATDAVGEIADGVWDEDATVHQTLGTFGQAIGDPGADADTIFSLVNTIQADTDDIQTRLPAALVSGRIDASVGAMATDVITAASIAAAAARKLADHILRRTYANARASADGDALSFRSLLGAVGKLINRVAISGTTLTVYQEDDLTSTAPGGTQTITTSAGADPINQIDTDG